MAQTADRGHDQLARHVIALPLDATGQLVELIIRRLRHPEQVFAGLGGRIAARMPLKELDAQPLFERVDMADDGGMMHAQHLCRAAYRADPRHVIGGPHLVPILHHTDHPARPPHCGATMLRRRGGCNHPQCA